MELIVNLIFFKPIR